MPRLFPLQKTNWESPQSTRVDVIDVALGKTGFHSVGRNGTKNSRDTWEVNALIDNKEQIEAFIHAHGGCQPFNFYWEGVTDNRTWICGLDDFNFVRMSPKWFQFSATFKEVRRFGV